MPEIKKTDKKGREETWQWDESPETAEALKKLHESTIRRLEIEAGEYGVGK